MLLVEKIELLCKEQNISIRKLEQKIGLSSSSIHKWSKSSPSVINLLKVADYFEISLDYLIGTSDCRTPQKQSGYKPHVDILHKDNGLIEISNNDEKDILKRLEQMLVEMEQSNNNIIFDGDIMDKRTSELFIISLENLLENTKNRFISNRKREKTL